MYANCDTQRNEVNVKTGVELFGGDKGFEKCTVCQQRKAHLINLRIPEQYLSNVQSKKYARRINHSGGVCLIEYRLATCGRLGKYPSCDLTQGID